MSETRMKVDDPNLIIKRYESLKRAYFSNRSSRMVDDEGIEIPTATPKEALIRQFENIGAEVPLTPNQPFTPIQFQRQE